MNKASQFRPAVFGVLFLTAAYLIACQLWYGSTPMGMDPVLDGKQNLLTAQKFLDGGEFDEPFHRAPLYPWLLALAQKLNFLGLSVPSLVRLINSVAVLSSTWLTGSLAWRIWKRASAVWVAGLLVGLNPVIIFFAGDPLDISLATTCYIGAAWMLFHGYKAPGFSWTFWLGGSLVIGLGMALRSHLLLLGICWPLLAGLAVMRNRHTRKLSYTLLAVGIGLVGPLGSFLGVGIANHSVSGEFRMTPWGGAYLLWAGNGPLNNGRYYAQTVRVEYEGEYANPTIFESIHHYQQQTGKVPPYTVGEMNDYFTGKAIERIVEDPKAWMALMIRKTYSLFHNYEQYDNKTFPLHKSISPYLSINPIGWGLILILATIGGTMLFYSRKTTFAGFLIIAALYAVMVLATFTANRYRVPLIPLLAVLAGGVTRAYYRREHLSRRGIITLCLLGTGVGVLTFFPFGDIAEQDTYLADYALLANAAHRQGRDLEAIHWAEQALVMDSGRDDLREVAALSRFNHWFTQPEKTPSSREAHELLEELEQLNRRSPALAFAQGVYLWKLGDHENACALWRFAAVEYGHPGSISALAWNGGADRDFFESLPSREWETLLAVKSGQGYQAASGGPALTADGILSIAEMYRIAYEPFPTDSPGP